MEGEEPFVFIIEKVEKNGKIKERLMSCLKRTMVAEGIQETIKTSKRESAPILCVTGKHLTPNGVYDRYILVIPCDAKLIDNETYDDEDITFWEIKGRIYAIKTIHRPDDIEKTIIQEL